MDQLKATIRNNREVIAWMLGLVVVMLAVSVWYSERQPLTRELTVYEIFPLFGLSAFSLMWTHFIVGALGEFAGKVKSKAKITYWKVSSWVVLILLLAHPMLLWWGLWRDGFGLPPTSYLAVYSAMLLPILLGSVSLVIFLAFELHRFYRNRTWWRYVEYAQVVAMLAIFYHGLSLGGELSQSWFHAVWWGYGLTLVLATVYTYIHKAQVNKGVQHE